MAWFWLTLAGILLATALGLALLRLADAATDRAAIRRFLALQPANPARFDPAMVANLPGPARRYFLYTIAPGTPLWTVAEITMGGELGFGSKHSPGYRVMRARQILAAPYGFVWQVRAGNISGTDAATPDASWSRFRLFHLLPVGRVGFDRDHMRTSFGRFIAEAVFWTPAALLPGPGIRWEASGPDIARVSVSVGGRDQEVEVTVAQDGQPTSVKLARWSNANADKTYRLQPFGGDLSRFRTFGGFKLPTRIEGGNFFGTPEYFPFYRSNVLDIRFPAAR